MKELLFGTSPETTLPHEFSMTFLRVFIGLSIAFAHGLGKIPPPSMLIESVAGLGFPWPGFFAWAAALSEFAGGVLLAIGLLTRPAAFFLAITMLVAAIRVHWFDPYNVKEMSLIYFSVFFMFTMRGAGAWSIDRFISRRGKSLFP